MAGLFVFIFILLAVYVGPYIHTVAPNAINVKARNQWPSLAHPFGTDNLGKDMLAQVLAGGRISLAVGITAMLLACSSARWWVFCQVISAGWTDP